MTINYIKLKTFESNQNENEKNNNKSKIFNYGLAFLKSYLAFLVEISHNFNRNSTKNKIILMITGQRIPHVPSFFIISFYFTCDNLLLISKTTFFKRLERLFIPYLIWPIIIWIINRLLNLKYFGTFDYSYEFLKLQLLYGHMYMVQFWYLWDLIVITIVFKIIILIFKTNSLFILHIVLIVSYLTQYSGFGYKNIFLKYPYYKRYTFSRIFGMLPLAVTGFTLGIYKIINIFQKRKIKTIFFSIVIYNILNNYNIFVNQPAVNYYGINLNINAICVILIFSIFPSEKIKNKYIIKLFKFLTNYSAGIFYLHISIKHFLLPYFEDIKNGTFSGVIMNYLICYLICFFGMLLFGRTRIKYLFS